MKLAKRLFLFVFAAIMAAPMLGCGVGTTAEDNRRTVSRIIDYDARMLVDDLGLLTQTNRTTRTSRWLVD